MVIDNKCKIFGVGKKIHPDKKVPIASITNLLLSQPTINNVI